jgi:outer membrane protein OmpA-like peptidoglycan-associated protein
MKKNTLLVGCLAFASLLVPAQSVMAQATDTTSKNHYYETGFGSNWFISAGAGINLFMIQNIPGIDNDRPLTAAGQFAIGKWLTPYTGLRLEVAGAPLKIYGLQEDNTWAKKNVGYVGVYGDFMWDMCNTFGGYNEKRVVSVIPFAGISFLTTTKDNFDGRKPYVFPASAGLKINFRLSHYVDLYLQDRFTFTSDIFDGLEGGYFLEPIMTATAGITVKFGKNRFTAYNPYDQQLLVNQLNQQINQLRGDLQACQNRPTQTVVQQANCPECPVCDLTSVVRFRINSAKIAREEQVNVYNASEWLKKNTGYKVEVTGYADKDTGTAEYNLDLSQRRAQAVADELVNTYGIDPSRISIVAKGSAEQAYPDHNNWNRVVIFVTQK